MTSLNLNLRNLTLGLGCGMLVLLAAHGVAFGAVLLTDSFDADASAGAIDDINTEIGTRQTGTLAMSTWANNEGSWWNCVLNSKDGNNVDRTPSSLMLFGKQAWNNYNFNLQTGQILTYDIDASVMQSAQLGAIVIGPTAGTSQTAGSVSVTLDSTGGWSIFDGTATVTSGSVGAAQFTAVSISLSDTGASTVMGVEIGGSSVLSGHAVATTLTDRYYTLGDEGPADTNHLVFDNLSITAVPEPNSVFLLMIGGLALLGWRRRGR